MQDMFLGGTETTTTTIDWTMTELMRNPRVMGKAQAEVRQVFKGINNIDMIEEHHLHKLKYLKLIIRESLRLHSPTPIILRASKEECEINGYTIPAKVRVAIQRDPKYWNDPERFKPERFEAESIDFAGGHFEYLPFGSGTRMCPGISFAMAVIELTLAQLLYNFNWELPNGVKPEDMNMIEKLGLSAPRQENLLVVATPYQFLG